MRTFKRISLFFLLILTILSLTAYAFRKQILHHFTPVVEQIGEVALLIKNDTCYLNSRVSVTNRSPLRIDIDTLKYTLAFFNKTYLQSKEFIGMTLPGYFADSINLSLKIPYKEIMEDMRSERKERDSASYQLNVLVQYATFLGDKELFIMQSEKLKIPRAPELDIVKITYSKIRLRTIQAKVRIKVINHGPIDLHITNMNYSMIVRKQGRINGIYNAGIDILPNGTTYIELPIEISPRNIGKTMFDVMINKDRYDYSLSIKALVASDDQPGQTFNIDLVKTGMMELKK